MLQSFMILSRCGVLLWCSVLDGGSTPPLQELAAVDALIHYMVLPDRSSDTPYRDPTGAYTLRWLDSGKQLLFVAVASTATLSYAGYAESLLRSVRDAWVSRFGGVAKAKGQELVQPGWALGSDESAGWSALAMGGGTPFAAFDEEYEGLLEAAMHRHEERGSRKGEGGSGSSSSSGGGGGGGGSGLPSTPTPNPTSTSSTSSTKGAKGSTPTPSSPSIKKGGSSSHHWNDFKYSKEAAASLDRSKKPEGGSGGGGDGEGSSSSSSSNDVGGGGHATVVYDGKSGSGRFLVEEGEEGGGGASTPPPITASWWSRSTAGLSTWLSSASGTRALTRADLEPVCSELKGVLVGKNVSEEVAEVITRSVGSQLEGRTLEGGVTLNPTARLQTAVSEALRDAIERILSPTDPVDLLHDVRCHVEVQGGMPVGKRDPYVAVFCGVNGVGKSTTLAKVAFHLRDNGCRVMIAACDSFRAGAVEQLKKHCANLDVELYAQGYQKDPVEIARAAIRKAREGGADVVLVDTAGRMQNNGTLMAQLARLVSTNKPDMVLFVGEALVGGDGVDQLREFNRALIDHAVDASSPRGIDGIVLTKFDTVDDKVGAALSMVHASNIPIAFLGTGQQYPDLKRMNTGAVLRALLN